MCAGDNKMYIEVTPIDDDYNAQLLSIDIHIHIYIIFGSERRRRERRKTGEQCGRRRVVNYNMVAVCLLGGCGGGGEYTLIYIIICF